MAPLGPLIAQGPRKCFFYCPQAPTSGLSWLLARCMWLVLCARRGEPAIRRCEPSDSAYSLIVQVVIASQSILGPLLPRGPTDICSRVRTSPRVYCVHMPFCVLRYYIHAIHPIHLTAETLTVHKSGYAVPHASRMLCAVVPSLSLS